MDIDGLTRRSFELWNARDFDRLVQCFHEDGVWDMSPAGVPGMGAYRGQASIRRFFDQWLESFSDASIEVEEVEVRGNWGMATVLSHGTGTASGIEVPFRYFGIGLWRDERMVHVENFIDEEKARQAFEGYAAKGAAWTSPR